MTDRDLARLCLLANEEPTISVGGVDCHIEGNVIAFAPTNEWADLWQTLDAWPLKAPMLGVRVHRGRWYALASFWLRARPMLEAERDPILTGFSLGGGDAIGIGTLLTKIDRPPKAIVTFGAPPIGGIGMRKILRGVEVRSYMGTRDHAHRPPFPWPLLYRPVRKRIVVPDCRHDIGDYIERVPEC